MGYLLRHPAAHHRVRNRDSAGHVRQMLSGGIWVLAGAAFLGGIVFLHSALRLSSPTRTTNR